MKKVYLVSYLIHKDSINKFNYMLFEDEPAIMKTINKIIDAESIYFNDLENNNITILGVSLINDDIEH